MSKGRNPKSEASKELAGTSRPDRGPTQVIIPVIQEIPRPPSALTTSGKRVWRLIVESMIRMGLFMEMDTFMVAAYCQEMGIYNDCMKEVKKNGPVVEFFNGKQVMNIISPYYKAANLALKNAKSIADSFGLTPAARVKISIMAMSENQPDYDEFSDI